MTALPPLVVVLAVSLAHAQQVGGKLYEFSLPRMGTTLRVKLYAANATEANRAANAVFDRVEELEQIFSDYRNDSELTQLSRHGADAPRVVSPEMFELLDDSARISALSGGAFDVTIGPLVVLWREARRTRMMPGPAALARARAAVGYQNIELDRQNHTVFLKRADMKLDVGAIGKGYAAEQAMALLRSRGIHSALVAAGGDMRIGAPPPGKSAWEIAIDSPDVPPGGKPCVLSLHDVAISTSGNSHQFVEINGRHLSHIVDPVTGWALEGAASSTVIAPDGATADGLATALSVMPPEKGLKLVDSQEGVLAYLVRQTPEGWRYYSSRHFPHACHEPAKGGQ